MNQQPFRTLIMWTIWAAAAIVVYLTLYRDTEVWSFLKDDTSRITWLILGLFAMGLVASFALTMMITREALRAQILEKTARAGGIHAIEIKSSRRAVDRFFYSIKATMEVRGEPDVETLLNVELAVYERISRTVELIGHLLITLGLIGTVMGLTLTLTGLTGSLNALGHDQEMLLLGLRQAMGGMGTAFYTTLLGAVLGGVLLRMFALINQHGVESLHDNMLRICLVYCSTEFVQTPDQEVRALNKEIETLEKNVAMLRSALGESKDAVHGLGEEIRAFNAKPGETGEPLELLIKRHREYCNVLRDEMRILYAMKRPWWLKLVELFRRDR